MKTLLEGNISSKSVDVTCSISGKEAKKKMSLPIRAMASILDFKWIKKVTRGRLGRDHMVVGFTTTMQSVPINIDVVGSNRDQREVYKIM